MSDVRISKILVPTDFSRFSGRAFTYAIEFARRFEAEIVLLHVYDTRVVDNIYHIHELSPEKARSEMKRSAEEEMAKLLQSPDATGLKMTCVYSEGIPPIEVREVAEEVGADLIVMGTQGKTGLSHLLYGSTAEGVVRESPCPVLTVHP